MYKSVVWLLIGGVLCSDAALTVGGSGLAWGYLGQASNGGLETNLRIPTRVIVDGKTHVGMSHVDSTPAMNRRRDHKGWLELIASISKDEAMRQSESWRV